MNSVALTIGTLFMCIGGFLFAVAVLAFIGWVACCAWIAFSDHFRAICKAESLIHSYRKNEDKFLRWLDGEENMRKGRREDLYGTID